MISHALFVVKLGGRVEGGGGAWLICNNQSCEEEWRGEGWRSLTDM